MSESRLLLSGDRRFGVGELKTMAMLSAGSICYEPYTPQSEEFSQIHVYREMQVLSDGWLSQQIQVPSLVWSTMLWVAKDWCLVCTVAAR